jgi:arylsulfatase A-like enzyme
MKSLRNTDTEDQSGLPPKKRCRFTIVLVIIGAIAVLVVATGLHLSKSRSGAHPVVADPSAPDIILVSIDSLRPDHLGCYGYPKPTSPTIDRLARGGVRCDNVISTTSWTLPAHAALFTGLYDSAHGLVDDGMRLAEAHETLAEVLAQAGYQTAGFFGGPYLHPAYGLNQGFHTYESCMTKLPDNASEKQIRKQARIPNSVSHADITGPRTLEKYSDWLQKTDERPMFVFLHLWDVHYDYIPPEKYIELFDPDYEGELDVSDYMQNSAIVQGMTVRDLQHVRALYNGEIRFTDDVLGEMLTALELKGRDRQALIIVTADHGEEFFDHGGKGHTRTLYDEVIKVPLIWSWTGNLPEGTNVTDQVRIIDIMPTILGLANVKSEAKIQGRDISPLLRGESLDSQSALSELHLPNRKALALRTGQLKIHKLLKPTGQLLFNLFEDPGEHKPLDHETEALRSLLADLETVTRESLNLYVARAQGTAQEAQVTEELRQRLQSLGYIGDGEEE